VVTSTEAKEWAREHLRGNCIRAATKSFQSHPARPGAFTHWGAAFKFGASLLGLPVGDYPHSRPPQTAFPDDLKEPVRDAYRAAGFIHAASRVPRLAGSGGLAA